MNVRIGFNQIVKKTLNWEVEVEKVIEFLFVVGSSTQNKETIGWLGNSVALVLLRKRATTTEKQRSAAQQCSAPFYWRRCDAPSRQCNQIFICLFLSFSSLHQCCCFPFVPGTPLLTRVFIWSEHWPALLELIDRGRQSSLKSYFFFSFFLFCLFYFWFFFSFPSSTIDFFVCFFFLPATTRLFFGNQSTVIWQEHRSSAGILLIYFSHMAWLTRFITLLAYLFK